MEEKPSFSPEESLRLIDSMIKRVKDKYAEDGHLYLFWGWLVFGISVLQFVLERYGSKYAYLPWTLTWVAVIYQIVFLRKKHRSRHVRGYADHVMAYIWLTFVIMMALTGAISGIVEEKNAYKLIDPMFIALYGMPIFLSGIVLRFKPLILGGISCWVLCLLAPLTPPQYEVLYISGAMLFGWILPGYALRSNFKRQNS